ncbi:MAG TPA: thioredoxin family protein [Kofleriaceae bacterium]|nr:thioredoxin family protein [Kofleriaceae bacterium]
MMRAKYVLSSLSLSVLALAPACGASQSEEPASTESKTAAPAATAPAATAEQPAAPAAAGQPAPDFTLTDLDGKQVSLASFRGKTVVLEWFNPGCPFVRYAHGEGPLKELAKKQTASGIVWLAINSGSAGKQGAGAEVNRQAKQEWAMEHPILLDETGATGKAYDAKTTPHMYIIDPSGALVYKGGLDNAPLGKAPAEGHINYVENALAAVAAGKPVEVAESKPYGCSVKYASE